MSFNKENIRKALGLSDSATDDDIIRKLAERVGVTSPTPTPTAPATMRWSMPIDPSAVQASSVTLSEARTELTGLFKKITEPDPNGVSLSELDAMEQAFNRHPELYAAYRRMVTQTG
jgi:hypothetical protein